VDGSVLGFSAALALRLHVDVAISAGNVPLGDAGSLSIHSWLVRIIIEISIGQYAGRCVAPSELIFTLRKEPPAQVPNESYRTP
jgi:hypothetical protein